MQARELISVVIPAYNHAPYIEAALDSVLQQAGVHIEVLIEDDGSSDGTTDVLRRITDPRVRWWTKATNEGACNTLNNLVDRASGAYVALINSDDVWADRHKLACQLDTLNANPLLAASFGRARFIDQHGAPLAKESTIYRVIFDQENRSRAQWLRHFFLHGNCLCHPTMLIRKEYLRQLGPYDNRFRQLPDFEMWIRVVKQHEIDVRPHELIEFRLLPGENASANTPRNTARLFNEHTIIVERFFDGVDAPTLQEGFGDLLREPEIPTPTHLGIEKALIFLRPDLNLGTSYRMIGLRALFQLLGDPAHRAVLNSDYGIDDLWLHEHMAEYSHFVSVAPTSEASAVISEVGRSGRRSQGAFARYLSFLRR